MKNIKWLAISFLIPLLSYLANAQVTNLTVNGVSSNFIMAQGDSIVWEFNLPVGGSAEGEIWIDLNADGVINPASDKKLYGDFIQTDGQSNGENGPGDLDGLVNGHIIYGGSKVGFAPAKYIFKFSNNGVSQSIVGTIAAMPSPAYTVSGVVTVPGGSAQNILVQANADIKNAQWTALTDANGSYTINFPASAGGLQWKIRPVDEIPLYIRPDQYYIILTGSRTGVNFSYLQPAATVFGYLKGEDGHLFSKAPLYAMPQFAGSTKYAQTDTNGFFQFGYTANEIAMSPIWKIQTGSMGVAPSYFPPQITVASLHNGDNRVDLIAHVADDSITGRVTINGNAPGGLSFEIFAFTIDSGQTITTSDPNTGNFTFHVLKKFSAYGLGFQNLSSQYSYTGNSWPQPGAKNITMNVNTTTDVEDNQSRELPSGFSLSQNYPNPFNPATEINYQIATRSLVSLRVYDQRGREVATLVNEEKPPGVYNVRWYANKVSSGLYLCRMQAGNISKTIKLLLIR